MLDFHIKRVASQITFPSDISNATIRDLFQSLPGLTSLDSAFFRKNPNRPTLVASQLPKNIGRELSQLQNRVHGALVIDQELALPLTNWAADRGLLKLPLRHQSYSEQADSYLRLCHLLGSKCSGWFINLYATHQNEHAQVVSVFDGMVNEWKQGFISRVLPFIQGGYLPISEEAMIERVKSTTFEMANFLKSPIGEISFDGNERKVVITSLDIDWCDDIDVYHELFHAVSGRAVLRYSTEREQKLVVQRVGVSINDLFEGTNLAPYFEWLNEAVTETLARLLSPAVQVNETGQQRPEAYEDEVKLLACLIDDWGISQDTIFEAYFQDYDCSAESGQAYPAWRNLSNEFKRVFGRGALKNLEAFVQAEGVERTLEILSELKQPELIFKN